MSLKLPKPFGKIIHDAFHLVGFDVKEAYVDEMEYDLSNCDAKGLREFLGIGKSDSVCDCFCKIVIVGKGEKNIIFEHKDSKHQRRFKDAKRQLENTLPLLENKNINVDFAVICKVSVEDPFVSQSDFNLLPPLKVIYVKIAHRQVFLENLNKKIPLLYY